jgi:hypothetical protein
VFFKSKVHVVGDITIIYRLVSGHYFQRYGDYKKYFCREIFLFEGNLRSVVTFYVQFV